MPVERSDVGDVENSTVSLGDQSSSTGVASTSNSAAENDSSNAKLTAQDLEDLEKIQAELDSLVSLGKSGDSLCDSPSRKVCTKVPIISTTTSIPVSLATTGMSTNSSGESVPMTLVNVGSTMLTKGGKSVLLVQKPLATNVGQAKVVGSKVTTVTPILANKAMTVAGSGPATITVPALKTDKGDLKVILPGTTGEMISIMPGKRLITPVTTSPIINRLKVVGTQAQFAAGSVSTFTTTSSLQNATLLTAGDQAQAPTILLASPTKTFTVARGNSTQVLRAIPGSPSKQGMVLFSPIKNKQLPMSITTAALAAAAAKSPQRIAPAPNASSASKVTIVTASPSAATTTTASGSSILARAAALPASPQKIIFRPLVPQVKQTGIPSNLLAGHTLTTVSGQTLKQMVVPVSSVMTTTGGGHSIQVPGNKFNYFRLVSAPQATSVTNTVSGTLKSGTLVPVRAITQAGTTGVSVSATSSMSGNPVRITVPIAPAVSVSQGQVLSKVSSSVIQTQQRLLIPSLRQDSTGGNTTTLSQFPSNTLISTNTAGGVQSFVMLSAQYLAQMASQAAGSGSSGPTRLVIQSQATNILPAPPVATPIASQGFVPIAAAQPRQVDQQQQQQQQTSLQSNANKQVNGRVSVAEPVDSRIRKPCNCTKSQCLKLYCDCFANGEFCHNCNCNNCFNNLDHEEDRQRAIKSCLDRNPHAFHPKIGKGRDGDHERRHTKGCNCKRSGCLKNYCECYEAKILCTNLCKCVGCKNFEDSSERKTLMHLADAAEVRVQQQAAARTKISSQIQDMPTRPPIVSVTGERLPFSFMTQEVMEATCQCLLARAEDSERNGTSVSIMERLILEEFGRCLMQIIDCANRTKASSSGDH